jgi:hypothetical protein
MALVGTWNGQIDCWPLKLVHPFKFFWDYWATWTSAHDDLLVLIDDGLDVVASLVAGV